MNNKKLIKALKIADAIRKSIKDQIGRYVYYENKQFTAESKTCRIEIDTDFELPKGYYNTKELIAVLSTPFHRPESDVDFIAYEVDDNKWKVEEKAEQLTHEPKHLYESIIQAGIAYNKKQKGGKITNNLFFTENTVLCTNDYYMLEVYSSMRNDAPFNIDGDIADILKKCDVPTSVSIANKYMQFVFNGYIIKTVINDNDTRDSINKLYMVLRSEQGYPSNLSKDQIDAIKSKCTVLRSKNQTTINIDDYLQSDVQCIFDIDYLFKIIDFALCFHYNAETKKLYFASENIRGVLCGIKL